MGTIAFSILEKHQNILGKFLPAQHLKALIYYRAGEYEKARDVIVLCIHSGISDLQTRKLLKKIESRIQSNI